jgi:hypothetical protein
VVSLWKAGFHPGPVVTIPWRAGFHPGPDHTHSGGKPPHCMRCRDPARRLRLREAFGVRPLAGAVKERHHGRRPTVPRLSFRPVLQPTPFAAHPTTLPIRGPSSTPARGWVDPHRRQGPEDRKAPPAELLAPVATEVPVAGSPPNPSAGSVGSLPQGPIHLLSNPPHARDLCPPAPRGTSRDQAFCVGFPVASAQKAKCAE